jgi:hypothetical protein
MPQAAVRPSIVIDQVYFEPALHTHQRGEEPDRADAGDQYRKWLPGSRPLADALGVIPRLGDDACRLQQHARNIERSIDLDQKFRFDSEKFRAEAVALLDAALGVAAVAAHIPFADRAGGTRDRIGPPHDADDEVARFDAASGRRLLDLAERFMTDHQPLLAWRCPPVVS